MHFSGVWSGGIFQQVVGSVDPQSVTASFVHLANVKNPRLPV